MKIFALKEMSEVVKGTLFSRYSRTTEDLMTVYENEFKDIQDAEDFYERVLIGYGDDSIAELGFAHIAVEGISQIAAKAIEDSRIGLSFIEKSTRYVDFSQVGYYSTPGFSKAYHEKMQCLLQKYNQLLDRLLIHYSQTQAQETRRGLKARALDNLRGLLPMGMLTNLGVAGNGRAFEHLLIKLHSSENAELQLVALKMHQALNEVIPSFVKRTYSDKGVATGLYYKELNKLRNKYKNKPQDFSITNKSNVRLIKRGNFTEVDVASIFLYPERDKPFTLHSLSRPEAIDILTKALDCRKNRFHKIPRAFEYLQLTFEIICSIGCWRDLQRHRICTQHKQEYTTDHGFDIPSDVIAARLDDVYVQAMESVEGCNNPYLIPMGYKQRWLLHINFRALSRLLELRSQPQGHYEYRKVCEEMYHILKLNYPEITEKLFICEN